ncbi:hypothetical protein NA56DRAFT_697277 [Hyaloscypha hepaticicola]|uniref:Ubiquitin-like domain-containing protein n=1 Tax=Hyaloscypha hepaticicola TaxID=2082293 RepID=A0A2J6QLE9_9HELO|nr:hypothetical protein NA56DRAFT_697277 [Hyaloscypha hepaticicola]
MSFGIPTGDFLASATLIKELISALRESAEMEYRELELELHGLQRALDELEHPKPGPGQEIAVNSVKLDAVEGWARKVQWNVSMPDKVQKLRAYIAAHVGSLTMRLLTVGLTTMTMAKKEASEQDCLLQKGLKSQMTLVTENTAKVETLYSLVTSQVVPQLQNLIGLARKEPPRFDNAFGRTIPIPVEYGWSKLEAIIRDQFSSSPGKEKAFAGEYEIFNTEDSSILITPQNYSFLRPSASITMDMFGKAQTPLPPLFRLLFPEGGEVTDFGDHEIRIAKKRIGSTGTIHADVFKKMKEEQKLFKNWRIHLQGHVIRSSHSGQWHESKDPT